MPIHSPHVTLHRQLAAIAIDPQTRIELERHYLAAGTVIEDAYAALAKAVEEGADRALIHARTESGWRSLEGVGVTDLRAAIE